MIGRRKEERRVKTMSEKFWVAFVRKGRRKSDPPAIWARLFEPTAVGVALLLVLLVAVVMSLGGCTKPDASRRILEREGYTDIRITGYSWFGCSEDDFFSTGFEAKKNGQYVEGTVCAGLFFKGATVRFDE